MCQSNKIAPPEIGSGRAFGSSVTPCNKIDIEITEIAWLDSYTTICKANKPIEASLAWTSTTIPAKPDPDNFCYDGCSEKPAIYFIANSAAKAHKKLKLKITFKVKPDCGTTLPIKTSGKKAILTVSFGTIRFTKDFILPVRGGSTTIIFEEEINNIIWLSGAPVFALQYDDNGTMATKAIHFTNPAILEAFILYDVPTNLYTNGVWVEALRFLFRKTGINCDQNIITSAGKITHYCHTKHGMIYDTKIGENFFFKLDYGLFNSPKKDGGEFCLRAYLSKKFFGILSNSDSFVVNCYDQAGAVQSLCGALGIKTEWIFMQPYGYINTTHLVGIGECNNPFYTNAIDGKKVENEFFIPGKGERRYPFGNHAFIRLKENSLILDATTGPYIGDKSLLQYAQNAIDVSANLEYNNLVTRLYHGTPSQESLLPKMLTQSPLVLEAVEKACRGKYQYYEHNYGYPCKGVTNVIW